MSNLVPGDGPEFARIALIGEAPGKTEEALGKPFVGASGNLLSQWFYETDLMRQEIYIDNLYPFRPPSNAIDKIDPEELVKWTHSLRERVASLPNVNVIVPTGNYATFALTGKGKVSASYRRALGEEITASDAEKKAGITKLRGSVYPYTTISGRQCKVIPTIHPAWFLRGNFHKQERAIADWKRIKREAESAALTQIHRDHFIDPTEHEIQQYIAYVEANPQMLLAIDIETWGNTLSCVGFAHSPVYSFTIVTTPKDKKQKFLPYIKKLCESPNPKVLQNGLFDAYWLHFEGIKIENWQWDTLAMHHAFCPNSEHSLDYLCSIYLDNYQYWKDEAKDAEEVKKYAKDLDSLWTYNGLDCTNTYHLFTYLIGELSGRSMLDFYHRHYQRMFGPLLAIMTHGVKVDVKRQKKWAKTLMEECAEIRKELEIAAGEDLYATKDFSPKKLKKFVNETLGLPKKYNRKTGTETLDEKALKQLIIKFADRAKPLQSILDHRAKSKQASFMKGAWDKDGRIRCSYKFTTEAGRLASSKNPMRKGYNLQNPDRRIRDTFLPDDGCVFVKIDMSQIEDRVVKMITRQPRMIELANTRPDEYDAHKFNASLIMGKPESEITYDERYLAKKTVHGAQRSLGPKGLFETVLKDSHKTGVVLSVNRCKELLDAYLDAFPEIRDHYFPFIRELMRRDRALTNTWGRKIEFKYDRFDDELYRRGYSFLPQSENADLLNQWGVIAGYHYIITNNLKSRINLQVHDEIIVSCPADEAWQITQFLVQSLEQPREHFGNTLVVPTEVTVARSWKDSEFEFKRLPSKDEFMDVVYKCLEDLK